MTTPEQTYDVVGPTGTRWGVELSHADAQSLRASLAGPRRLPFEVVPHPTFDANGQETTTE